MMLKRLAGLIVFFFLSMLCFAAEQTFESDRYTVVYPDTFTGIEEATDAFKAMRSAFDVVFRFDSGPSYPVFRVVVLADKASFDSYVTARIGETRRDFLFLRYGDASRSEIVLYPQRGDAGYAAFAGPSLARALFLQYLYAYVPQPPLWILDGFQAFFENIEYDPASRKLSLSPNAPWLESAKTLHADPATSLDPVSILGALTGSFDSARYYPQAWAFATFLLSTENPEYQRFVHECALIIANVPVSAGTSGTGAPAGGAAPRTQKELTDIVRARFVGFNDPEKAAADYSAWLSGQHTFNELVQSGVKAYNEGKFAGARIDLTAAAGIRNEDPLVTYYLGLVAYSLKEYAVAEGWYRKALESGGDVSTVNWALGLNAWADKRYAEAKVYLETARQSNPARYEKKVSDLISSMPK
jgi:tetratricopeptide (TPR) repeat protein